MNILLMTDRVLRDFWRLFVKAEIYEFHVSSFSFWGFIIEKGQKKLDPAKIRAVFLRFANFYRRFIKNYS